MTALLLLHSLYWYTTVIGCVLLIGLGLYAYSIRQQQTNFVVLYVLIVLVNLLKNALLLYFYISAAHEGEELEPYEWFLVVMMCIDSVVCTVSADSSGSV